VPATDALRFAYAGFHAEAGPERKVDAWLVFELVRGSLVLVGWLVALGGSNGVLLLFVAAATRARNTTSLGDMSSLKSISLATTVATLVTTFGGTTVLRGEEALALERLVAGEDAGWEPPDVAASMRAEPDDRPPLPAADSTEIL